MSALKPVCTCNQDPTITCRLHPERDSLVYCKQKIVYLEKQVEKWVLRESGWTAFDIRINSELQDAHQQIERLEGDVTILDKQVEEQQAEIEDLKVALQDAIDGYEEYSVYAGDYLCKKHQVAEHIAELKSHLKGPQSYTEMKRMIE